MTTLVCVFLLVGGAVVVFMPRGVPYGQCSDIYKRYTGVEGIDATYVKDYRVADTVTVGVTVLKAETDSAWALLLRDFNVTPPPPEVLAFKKGKNVYAFWAAAKSNYAGPKDPVKVNNDIISASWSGRTIWVFAIETEKQYSLVVHRQVEESIRQSSIK